MTRYSIWVLEYAIVEQFPESAALYGSHNAGARRLPFSYVLLRSADAAVLVDVGYDHTGVAQTMAEQNGVAGWRSPKEMLSYCKLTPEDVTHVILTHAHWDHMGALSHFPHAKVFIQSRELTSWVAKAALGARFRHLMNGIDPTDVTKLTRFALDGRLQLLDGAATDVLPGIDIYPAFDTHTDGSQYVVVRNEPGSSEASWVLTGDLIYTFDNLTGGNEESPLYIPVGLATGSQTNLVMASDELLKKAKGELRKIVPVHEARLKDVFPSKPIGGGLSVIEVTTARESESVLS